MTATNFSKITLDTDADLFAELSSATDFESVAKGRLGNHLVDVCDNGVPIVRTTTKYNMPACHFLTIHRLIAGRIQATMTEIPVPDFNNALIEVYDTDYTKMNYHSDQSLDLAEGSYIALFSCYEKPAALSEHQTRKLKIKNKVNGEESELSLTHHSVILFSLDTNRQFQHKIVLDTVTGAKPPSAGNKWLGITFRTSKTYIQFKEGQPYFSGGQRLTLADKDQETAFYKLRGEENRSLDFIYPELIYTVNAGDMMMPKNNSF